MLREELLDHADAFLRAWPVRGVDAETLVAVMEQGSPQRLEAGALLCAEGGGATAWYLLLEGALDATRGPDDQPLARIEAPALVGHMAVIDRSPRSASVRVAAPALLIAMDQRVHDRLVGDLGPLGAAHRRLLLASLSRQLCDGIEHLRDVVEGGEPGADAALLQRVERALRGWLPARRSR